MNTPTLNNILNIRRGLWRPEKCCINYEVPLAVLKAIGTMATYSNNDKDSNNENVPCHLASLGKYLFEEENDLNENDESLV